MHRGGETGPVNLSLVSCRNADVEMNLTRYERELAALPATYERACAWHVEPLARLIAALSTQSLRVVGSGGSYSLAAFCARLHTLHTRQSAFAVTPLEVAHVPYLHGAGLLCLTASGRNKDIRAAFELAALAETKPTAALCLAKDSPIKALSVRYGFTDVVEAALDIEADGFLAVNSLLASCVLLARAYRTASGRSDRLPPTFENLMAHMDCGAERDFDIQLRSVLERKTISVLYSSASR
jgi:fructoselysine-6-P-deglycase FrlB-like protein